jgi:hypothetical protein
LEINKHTVAVVPGAVVVIAVVVVLTVFVSPVNGDDQSLEEAMQPKPNATIQDMTKSSQRLPFKFPSIAYMPHQSPARSRLPASLIGPDLPDSTGEFPASELLYQPPSPLRNLNRNVEDSVRVERIPEDTPRHRAVVPVASRGGRWTNKKRLSFYLATFKNMP